jgi:hypothetical protein
MAVAVPSRRTAPAPAPSRTSPPPKRKPPARKPGPSRSGGAPAKAPSRRTPARAPQRARPRHRVAAAGQLIPLAVGRTAVTVGQLPDSGLMVRMTRGRAWIAVLGLLLVGIVALNVVTLSFAATYSKIDQQITALEEENSVLAGREGQKYGTGRVRSEAGEIGLVMPNQEEPRVVEAGPGDVQTAAQRLAGAGG